MANDTRRYRDRPEILPGRPTNWRLGTPAEERRTWRALRDIERTKLEAGSTSTTGGGTLLKVAVSVKTLTTNYTILAADGHLRADTSGGSITFLLPAASAVPGCDYTVKKISDDDYSVTVGAVGADLIDGDTSVVIDGFQDALTFRSVSDGWDIF